LALFLAIEASAIGQFLRASWWAYPLVNIGHVLGIAALFGSILVLDLRLLGFWPTLDRAVLARPVVPVAAAGLTLALATGLLLFSARASEYGAMPVFWLKLAFVAAGLANVVGTRATGFDRRAPRLAGAVSLSSWTAAIAAGRLIGYGST
jgi:hypothetical protein